MNGIVDFPSLRSLSRQQVTLEAGGRTRLGIYGSQGIPMTLAAATPGYLTITPDRSVRTPAGDMQVYVVRCQRTLGPGEPMIRLNAVITASGLVFDWLDLNLITHQARVDGRREAVIRYARTLIGCHYVWGGTGDRPDQADGSPRPGTVHMERETDTPQPMHSAAYCAVNGHHTCAGRCGHPDVRSRTDAQKTRRYRQGHTVTPGVVMGEPCQGIRHFDCVGFINHCLTQVYGHNIQQGIAGYRQSAMAANPAPRDLLPADIITTGGHIVFATGAGTKIHASSTDLGVIEEPLGHSWTPEHKVTRYIS